MQSCFFVTGLVLLGQLAGNDQGRYPGYETAAPPAATTPDGGVQNNTPRAEQPAADIKQIAPRETPVSPPTGQALFDEQPQQPATQPTTPVVPASKPVTVKPSELMAQLTTPPLRGQLTGAPLTLSEAVRGSRSRDEQAARVDAYWELSAAVTEYYLAVRAATEVEALQKNISQPSYVWDDTRRALTAHIQVARQAAETAQLHLQGLLGRSPASLLPLPSDLPHSGAYQTRYEKNFAGRLQAEAEHLNQLIPELHEELLKQAEAIVADQRWLQTVDQQRSPQSDGTVLLKTYELVNLRRQAFVETVNQYNGAIARYAQLATPGEIGGERLVAMLIGRPRVQTRFDSEVTRTSAEEPQQPPATNRTFADEPESPPQQQTKVPADGVERSILRKPAQ